MKILVTYFEAFDGRTENSTGLAVRAYQQEIPQNEDVVFLELPVIFSNCWLLLEKHLSENKYDYILALGEASLRKIVTVERVALNWVDARIPDNEGFHPQPIPIFLLVGVTLQILVGETVQNKMYQQIQVPALLAAVWVTQ